MTSKADVPHEAAAKQDSCPWPYQGHARWTPLVALVWLSSLAWQHSSKIGITGTGPTWTTPSTRTRPRPRWCRDKSQDNLDDAPTLSHLKSFIESAVPPIRLFLMIIMMPLKRRACYIFFCSELYFSNYKLSVKASKSVSS